MKKSLFWSIFIPVVGMVLYHFLMVYRIRDIASYMLIPFSECCTVEIGTPFYRLNGEIGIERLRITPLDPSEGGSITADEAVLQTPGFWWMHKTFFGGGDSERRQPRSALKRAVGSAQRATDDTADETEPSYPFPAAQTLGLEFKNLSVDSGGFLPDIFDWVGWHSGAPFEAEGCLADTYFQPFEIAAMQLPVNNISFRWHYRVTGARELIEESELIAPGRGRFLMRDRIESSSPEHYLFAYDDEQKTLETTLQVDDDGFVAARNSYCGTRDKVSPAEFVDRHVQSIQRILLAFGYVATPELEAVYRDYARRGGQLVYRSEPSPGVKPEDYHHYPVSEQWRLMNATLSLGGRSAPFQLSAVQPIALPDSATGSIYDLVLLERNAGLNLSSEPFDPTRVPVSAPTVERRRSPASTSASSATTTAKPAIASTVVTVDRASPVIPFGELNQHIDADIILVRKDGQQQRAKLIGVAGNTLRLRRRLGGGFAEYTVTLEQLGRVEAIPRNP